MSTFVITGANRGIGLELCRQLAGRGDEVTAVCRNAGPDLPGLGVRIIDGVDVTDGESLAALAADFEPGSVDVLVNNAGVLERDDLGDVDPAALRRQFEVNAIAPLQVTRALLGRLSDAAKVAIITSRMGSIGDNGSGAYYGYRMSKAAVNMAGASLAVDLRPRGVAVALLHPGMVATDMTGGNGIPVSESAEGLIARLDELDLSNTGTFWHANGEALPW
jgi:NAD(P)-dependent dehydrogenase (short-subunit alcohol dehydrogenase family)